MQIGFCLSLFLIICRTRLLILLFVFILFNKIDLHVYVFFLEDNENVLFVSFFHLFVRSISTIYGKRKISHSLACLIIVIIIIQCYLSLLFFLFFKHSLYTSLSLYLYSMIIRLQFRVKIDMIISTGLRNHTHTNKEKKTNCFFFSF